MHRLDRWWQVFLTGALCGTVFVSALWTASVWWKPRRSAHDEAAYDQCLAAQQGNTIACDAFLRLLQRENEREEVLKKEAARLLAAGFSKREVVEWAGKNGFVGKQLSDAVGISLQELQQNKY